MKKQVHDLVEAVRALGLKVRDAEDPSKRIRVGGDPRQFPDRLVDLQRALEALDAAGGISAAADASDPRDDPRRLRAALDALIRMHQVKGGALAEIDAVVRTALGLDAPAEEGRKKKGGKGLPAFVPKRIRKRTIGFGMRTRILPERPGEASLSDLRRIVAELDHTAAMAGATVPQGEREFERVRSRKLPPPPPGPRGR